MGPVGPRTILWLFPQFWNSSLEPPYSAAGRIPHWFPDPSSESYYGGKGQVEATRPTLPGKIVNTSTTAFLDGSAPSRTWKMQGWWFLLHPIHLAYWPVQKTDGSSRMTVDYCKFSQVVTPVVAAVPDMSSLLRQMNVPVTWCAAGSWKMPFFF